MPYEHLSVPEFQKFLSHLTVLQIGAVRRRLLAGASQWHNRSLLAKLDEWCAPVYDRLGYPAIKCKIYEDLERSMDRLLLYLTVAEVCTCIVESRRIVYCVPSCPVHGSVRNKKLIRLIDAETVDNELRRSDVLVTWMLITCRVDDCMANALLTCMDSVVPQPATNKQSQGDLFGKITNLMWSESCDDNCLKCINSLVYDRISNNHEIQDRPDLIQLENINSNTVQTLAELLANHHRRMFWKKMQNEADSKPTINMIASDIVHRLWPNSFDLWPQRASVLADVWLKQGNMMRHSSSQKMQSHVTIPRRKTAMTLSLDGTRSIPDQRSTIIGARYGDGSGVSVGTGCGSVHYSDLKTEDLIDADRGLARGEIILKPSLWRHLILPDQTVDETCRYMSLCSSMIVNYPQQSNVLAQIKQFGAHSLSSLSIRCESHAVFPGDVMHSLMSRCHGLISLVISAPAGINLSSDIPSDDYRYLRTLGVVGQPSNMSVLLKLFGALHEPKHIILGRMMLNASESSEMCHMLSKCTLSLKSLVLSNIVLENDHELSSVVRKCKSLTFLSLRSSRVSKRSMHHVLTSLPLDLRVLDVSHCSINSEGFRTLGQYLGSSRCSLECLSLEGCGACDRSLTNIIAAIETPRDDDHSGVDSESLLSRNQTPTDVEIGGTRGWDSVYQSIISRRHLLCLNVSLNFFGDESIAHISTLMRKNRFITTLLMDGIEVW